MTAAYLDSRLLVSIHAPNEGSDFQPRAGRLVLRVSIHAPNEGSDLMPWLTLINSEFQSTLPMKGATI